jgi:hypothetical protein
MCDRPGCGTSVDCNFNRVPDGCDLASGASVDVDPANGIPDECDPPEAPIEMPPDKVRMVSFGATALAGEVAAVPVNRAVRVTFLNLPGAYGIWNGQQLWVGQPQDVCELSGVGPGQPCPSGPTSKYAKLQCGQHCRTDWNTLGTVHVWGEGVIPGATYRLQAINCADDPNDETRYSEPPLVVTTPRWGDCCGPFAAGAYPGPDNSVDVTVDVLASLEKFRNTSTAPIKARADVIGDVVPRVNLDSKINISDVTQVLNGFRSLPYPFTPTMPAPCN